MKTAKKSFAYLVLILGALIMVLPFFWMIISSLKTAAEVNTTPPTFWPKELVFENYVYAFEKAPFLRYFCNSLLVTIVCVACTMFTTILAAFAFSRLKFPGRDLLFSLLLSLMMIPFEMLIITNYTTIVKLGLNDTLIALILPFTSSIFYTYILRNFFLAIPDSLYYSARVDGREQLALPLARHGAYVPPCPRDDWPARRHCLLELLPVDRHRHKHEGGPHAAVRSLRLHDLQRHPLRTPDGRLNHRRGAG